MQADIDLFIQEHPEAARPEVRKVQGVALAAEGEGEGEVVIKAL